MGPWKLLRGSRPVVPPSVCLLQFQIYAIINLLCLVLPWLDDRKIVYSFHFCCPCLEYIRYSGFCLDLELSAQINLQDSSYAAYKCLCTLKFL